MTTLTNYKTMQALLPSPSFLKKTILPHCMRLFTLLLFISFLGIQGVKGQIAVLELGTTSYSTNTTGAVTFTSKDNNLSTLPSLSLTSGQQGQAGGNGYVSSKAWNNASLTTTTYWQFTLTAATNYQISVTSIALKMYRSSTGATTIALASDADNYVSLIGGGAQSLASATNTTLTFSGITISNKSSITFRVYAYGASASTGTLRIGDGSASSSDITVTGTVSSVSPPTLNAATLSSALSNTYGAASADVSFTASGSNLSGNITATAQSGYEVTTTSGSGYSSSVTVASGTTVYVRHSSTKAVATDNGSTCVVLSSTGATSVNITTSSSGNIVYPSAPTATSPQILCPSATVNSLAATGTAIQWYDAASGGNLLSSATALTHNTHYYATQTVNGCESSTRTDVTASLQNQWTGSANNNWNNAGNWSCGNVPSATENLLINSGSPALDINYEVPATYTLTLSGTGTLTINPGNKLTITGTADFGNKLVTVAANASNTGAIVLNGGSLQNATNVALQQWFTGQRAWRMLSNPFTTSITGSSIASNNSGFSVNQSGTGDMVVYNSSTDTWSANTTIAANTCYGFFYKGLQSDFNGTPGLSNYSGAGPTASVFSVKGSLNTGSVSITPSNVIPIYTLVGNPFAAPVNSIALTGGAAAPYYYYQANAASTDSKVKSGAWIAASSNSSSSTTIPMMGLIAYQAQSSTSFTIPIAAINTAATAVSALFKTTAAATQLKIDLIKNNILFDRCIVREDIDANAQLIDQKDLLKMENVTANVYALTPANDRLAVYTEPAFTQAIPLAISAPVGTYQFNIQNDMNSMADWYLIDNYLHQQKLLTNNSTYIFDINNDAASKGSQRFELSKQAWTTSVGTASNKESIQLLGNVVQDHITLQIDASIHQANYQLVDLRGAVLAKGTLSAGKQEIAMASFVSGMYLLHIQNDQQHSVYKITKY